MHGSLSYLVVAFVAGKFEVVEVGLACLCAQVVIAQGGEEAIAVRARPIIAGVGVDEVGVVFSDVCVDGGRSAAGVVIVAYGNDEVGRPAMHQGSDRGFRLSVYAVVADDGKVQVGETVRWAAGDAFVDGKGIGALP